MSVERRRAPSLVDRPVAIVKDGRVFDLSPDLRAKGLAPGTKRANLLELCPNAATIAYEPERYEAAWEEALDLYARHVPAVEPVSFEEALSFSGSLSPGLVLPGPPATQAFLDTQGLDLGVFRRMGMEALTALGLTVGFGLGPTKLLARAAGLKLAGQPTLRPGQIASVEREAADLPVSLLYPFDPKTLERLERLGFRRLGSVRELGAAELARQFGWPLARRLQAAAAGGDDAPVLRGWPLPALGVFRSFEGGLGDQSGVNDVLSAVSGAFARELTDKGLATGEIRLVLTGEAGRREEASRRLDRPVRSKPSLMAILGELAQRSLKAWAAASGARFDPPTGLEVRLERIRRWAGRQIDFGYLRGFQAASAGGDFPAAGKVAGLPAAGAGVAGPVRAREEVREVASSLARRFGRKVIREVADDPPEKSRREAVLAFYDPLRAEGRV